MCYFDIQGFTVSGLNDMACWKNISKSSVKIHKNHISNLLALFRETGCCTSSENKKWGWEFFYRNLVMLKVDVLVLKTYENLSSKNKNGVKYSRMDQVKFVEDSI